MFKLILAMLISIQSFAGVGGVAGGNVLFQRDSTYISPISRSLCHNGVNFRAVIEVCAVWNDKNQNGCRSWKEKEIFQPIYGVKKTCVVPNEDHCTEMKERPFVQSPVREVEIVDSNSRVLERTTITVPSCF